MDSSFWQRRVQTYGHTGWADRSIYAFDQQARLFAIRRIVGQLVGPRLTALDFGTGTGDFARLLAGCYEHVIAFDTCDDVIRVAMQCPANPSNVEWRTAESIMALGPASVRTDLVLSVTTLDHICVDDELRNTLRYLNGILSDDGWFVALEHAPEEIDTGKIGNGYQRFDTYREWLATFLLAGFHVCNVYGLYHPVFDPSKSFQCYTALRRVAGERIARASARPLIHLARDVMSAHPAGCFTKIFVARKVTHASLNLGISASRQLQVCGRRELLNDGVEL